MKRIEKIIRIEAKKESMTVEFELGFSNSSTESFECSAEYLSTFVRNLATVSHSLETIAGDLKPPSVRVLYEPGSNQVTIRIPFGPDEAKDVIVDSALAQNMSELLANAAQGSAPKADH